MKLFIASLDTEHFSFDGVGQTEREARDVLSATLAKHGEHHGFAAGWHDIPEDEFPIRSFECGVGYRDQHPLFALGEADALAVKP